MKPRQVLQHVLLALGPANLGWCYAMPSTTSKSAFVQPGITAGKSYEPGAGGKHDRRKIDSFAQTTFCNPGSASRQKEADGQIHRRWEHVEFRNRWTTADFPLRYRFDADMAGYKRPAFAVHSIKDAFKAWARVCGVDFVQVEGHEETDIAISFDICGEGTVGTCSPQPAYGFAKITFSTAEQWTDSLAFDAGLHEIGHALGLGHSQVSSAVMSAVCTVGASHEDVQRMTLQEDDIEGCRALFGPPRPR